MNAHARAAAIAVLLALAVAGPARAAASASVGIDVVSLTLIDLDPLDGIAPAILFAAEDSQSYAYTDVVFDGQVLPLLYQPTSAQAQDSFGRASSATGPDGASARADVSGGANGSTRHARGGSYFHADVRLTPRSALVLTTQASGRATTSLGSDGSRWEFASAAGSLELRWFVGDGIEYHRASASAQASYAWNGERYVGQDRDFDAEVILEYANLSDDSVSGQFYAETNAYAESPLPVPEPAPWGLLLAGLAGVQFLTTARCRGRAAAP